MDDDNKLGIAQGNSLNDSAQRLSISPNELKIALSQRVIAAGGEVVEKKHNLTEAEYGRDALAKVIS